MGAAVPVHTKHTRRRTSSTAGPFGSLSEPSTLKDRLSLCYYLSENTSNCGNDESHTSNSTTKRNNINSISLPSTATLVTASESIGICNGCDHDEISSANDRFMRRSYDPLFKCFINNIYPEKRQSDPHICHSFCNKSFEIDSPSRDRLRFYSQFDIRKNAMPNITEYCFEEPTNWTQLLRPKYDNGDSMTSSAASISSVSSLPKIKLRICDEWGRRINSIESPGSDLFDEILAEAGLAMTPTDTVPDAFDVIVQNGTEKGRFDHIEKCQRCGHRILKLQFSTSFNVD